jgi:hypothetical protein
MASPVHFVRPGRRPLRIVVRRLAVVCIAVPVVDPLPYVARYVEYAIRASASWVVADWGCVAYTGASLRICLVVGQGAIRRFIAPWIGKGVPDPRAAFSHSAFVGSRLSTQAQ